MPPQYRGLALAKFGTAFAGEDGLAAKADIVAKSLGELNLAMLAQVATAGLSPDAALAVYRALDMIDEKTYDTLTQVQDLNTAYLNGYMTLATYTAGVRDLGEEINLLPDYTAVLIDVITRRIEYGEEDIPGYDGGTDPYSGGEEDDGGTYNPGGGGVGAQGMSSTTNNNWHVSINTNNAAEVVQRLRIAEVFQV